MKYSRTILHWINDKETQSDSNKWFEKINPADGKVLAQVTRGNMEDASYAVKTATMNFYEWRNMSVVNRADILRRAVRIMEDRKEEIATIVHSETGKSMKDALGEVYGSIELGYFYAGEGRRFYGKVVPSSVSNRISMIVREPVGVCVLIVPANTPIANITWKTFPALLCGNTAILKASKDAPYTALWLAKILKEAGLTSGVFSVLQGMGEEIGNALVEDERVSLVSFTGSLEVGRNIQRKAGLRFAKVSLELGGKNPLAVCDDTNLERVVNFTISSAFSNAGQRCAAGSRIIILSSVYENFRKLLLKKTKQLKVGVLDSDDFGPVINESQLLAIIKAVKMAKARGAKIIYGGNRLLDVPHRNGFYFEPTIIEDVSPDDEISQAELFGPVTCLYKAKDLNEAIELANNSLYGLTAAIHTSSIHRIQEFIKRIQTGVISVNGPTFGSEPHMPFGGVKNSGNGSREPGLEALDIYSNIKTIYIKHDPNYI